MATVYMHDGTKHTVALPQGHKKFCLSHLQDMIDAKSIEPLVNTNAFRPLVIETGQSLGQFFVFCDEEGLFKYGTSAINKQIGYRDNQADWPIGPVAVVPKKYIE